VRGLPGTLDYENDETSGGSRVGRDRWARRLITRAAFADATSAARLTPRACPEFQPDYQFDYEGLPVSTPRRGWRIGS
jgi:hypothetical protein